MRKRILFAVFTLVIAWLLMASFAKAQTPTPAPTSPSQHFSLSGSVVSFMGPGGAAPASIVDGWFNLTPNLSAGYQQITIPTVATARLGLLDYGKPLSSWVGKKLTAKFVFDASKVKLDIFVGAGKLNESALNVNHIAETAGMCVSYPVGANVSVKLACGQWLHGGIVNGLITNVAIPGALPTTSSTGVVSTGVQVHF